MTFFLVIDLVLRIFPFFSHIFRMFTMLNVVYMTISSQEKHNFHSVHAFTHIRQHYFSKYWGDQCMGGPSTSTFGGDRPPSPPRSPPLPAEQYTHPGSGEPWEWRPVTVQIIEAKNGVALF